jgi:hypothetical protein
VVHRHLAELRVGRHQVHLRQHLAERNVAQAVDDDPHGALVAMGTDEGDGFLEVGIRKPRHGDEKLVGQVEGIHAS